jgi:hypothetical protein
MPLAKLASRDSDSRGETMIGARMVVAAVAAFLAATVSAGWAQQTTPSPSTTEAKPAEKPKTFWEEHVLFAYVENSYVWNLGHTGRRDVNELRFYDFDAEYSFNVAEFSIKNPTGVRTAVTAAGAGGKVSLWGLTATAPYKIWKGLLGRVEYRHDEDFHSKVFKVRAPGLTPTSKYQDTITFVLDYLCF